MGKGEGAAKSAFLGGNGDHPMGRVLVGAGPSEALHHLQVKLRRPKRRRYPRLHHENRHHVAQVALPLHHEKPETRLVSHGEPSFPRAHRGKHALFHQASRTRHLRRLGCPAPPHAPPLRRAPRHGEEVGL